MTHIFLHLEKAGGVTMRDVLARQGYKNVFDIPRSRDYAFRYADLMNMSWEDRQKIDLIVGHQPYGIHQVLRGNFAYFTMLREPVSRLVSCYHYYRRTSDSPWCRKANEHSLVRFVENRVKLSFDNGMVRKLCGGLDDVEWGCVTREHFDMACRNLLRGHFGLTEMYDESLVHFYVVLGWKKFPFYTRANFAKQRSVVNSEAVAILELNNAWDVELYDMARKIFLDSLTPYAKAIRQFKLLNATIGRAFIGRRLGRLIRRIWK